ncbi:hypothetical protein [Lacunimicrobium album]
MSQFNWKSFGSLLALLILAGCPQTQTSTTEKSSTSTSNPESHETGGHSHGSGPNGGVVFDLGAYHAEFTVDHPAQKVQVLFTDGQKPIPVTAKEFTLNIKETKTADGKVVAPMTITLTPSDAVDGKAAAFTGTDPGIGNVADFAGTVIGEIDGKPAQGNFAE